MHDDRAIVEERIRRTLRERIQPAVHGPGRPLEVAALHVPGEPISVDEARSGEFTPFPIGSPWGTPWSTTWFRMRGQAPAEWEGQRVEAIVDLGGGVGPGFTAEALVWADHGPLQGLHPDHRSVVIGDPAAGGDAVDLLVEAAANPMVAASFQPTPMGDRSTAPEVPLYRLGRAELAVRRHDVWHLVLDLKTLVRLMVELPDNEPRRNLILRAIERSLDVLDRVDVVTGAAAARAELADVLAQPAHASAHRISAAGHAHIDTAWLWPLRETRRKCARTFSTAVGLMDEYPEYVFVCSQAQQYAWIKEQHPDLYERMRARIADGRFVPVGSMWVEADCNLPSGESLARQFVHGKRFFRDEFGVDTTEVWIPDVFGYSGQLPQLIDLAGCRWFLTQKLSWNQTNRFPHHTFWWEGIDGTRVFTHFPPAETYNGSFHANELTRAVHGYSEHGRANRSFYPFGHGDGGGGPTREMLELARRQADLEGSPRIEIESPERFFEQAHAEYPDAPVWRGELYLEMHRGTYTTQARTKWGNRRGELLLREAELWSVLANREAGAPYPAGDLDAAWKTLLLHQFHDIIPGSSIAWVHRDTEADHERLHAAAEGLIEAALTTVAATMPGIVLANAAGHDRQDVVVVSGELVGEAHEQALIAVDVHGLTTPVQRLAGGGLAFVANVPGSAVSAVGIRAGESDSIDAVDVDERRLENSSLRVTLDEHGHLASVFDKSAGRETLAGPGNVLQLHPDHPNQYDAWDIDDFYRHSMTEISDVESIEVVESGPVLGSLRVTRTFGASRIVQTLSLAAESPRLNVESDVEWHEDEKLLKVAFPLAVRAAEASYEIQFGHVRRATHTNTSWDAARFEVCGHKWADLSEPGYGVALLNDCKYGHDCVDNVLRLTLLRAPNYPDPHADHGQHRFRYSLLPHSGSLQDAAVPDHGYAFNLPIRAVAGTGTSAPQVPAPVVTVDHPAVVVEAVKLADDGSGDLVVRCYEAWGGHASAGLRVGEGLTSASFCDLHEQPLEPVELDAVLFTPFQIRTLRIQS